MRKYIFIICLFFIPRTMVAQCDAIVPNGSFEEGSLMGWQIVSRNVSAAVLPAGTMVPSCGIAPRPQRPTTPTNGSFSYAICFNGTGNQYNLACQPITILPVENKQPYVVQFSWFERITWDLDDMILSTGKTHHVTIRDSADNILKTCFSTEVEGGIGTSGDTEMNLFECDLLVPQNTPLTLRICFEDNLPDQFIGECTLEIDDVQANILCNSIVPTFSSWGKLIFLLLTLNLGVFVLRRKMTLDTIRPI